MSFRPSRETAVFCYAKVRRKLCQARCEAPPASQGKSFVDFVLRSLTFLKGGGGFWRATIASGDFPSPTETAAETQRLQGLAGMRGRLGFAKCCAHGGHTVSLLKSIDIEIGDEALWPHRPFSISGFLGNLPSIRYARPGKPGVFTVWIGPRQQNPIMKHGVFHMACFLPRKQPSVSNLPSQGSAFF